MKQHFLKSINIINHHLLNNKEFLYNEDKNLVFIYDSILESTAYLEALYLNIQATDINSFANALMHLSEVRGIKDMNKQMERISAYESDSNINYIRYNFTHNDGKQLYSFDINGRYDEINKNDFYVAPANSKSNYIKHNHTNNSQLEQLYAAVQINNKELILNEFLRSIDSRIKCFKIMNRLPKCLVDGEWLDLDVLNSWIRYTITIFGAILTAKNGYVFIEKIDLAVPERMFKDWFVLIRDACADSNCQLFATISNDEFCRIVNGCN